MMTPSDITLELQGGSESEEPAKEVGATKKVKSKKKKKGITNITQSEAVVEKLAAAKDLGTPGNASSVQSSSSFTPLYASSSSTTTLKQQVSTSSSSEDNKVSKEVKRQEEAALISPVSSSKEARKFKPAAVSFEREGENRLSVTIETERFRLQSCTMKDQDNYRQVFGDPKVMEKNGTGEIDTDEELKERMEQYVMCWENNEPINSSLAVFDNETDDFMGQVALYASRENTASFFYLFRTKYWNSKHAQKVEEGKAAKELDSSSSTQPKTYQHVGSESVSAVVLDYVPLLKTRGYKVNLWAPQDPQAASSSVNSVGGYTCISSTPLETLQTTVRLDNPGSVKILESVGMEKIEERFMFGNGMRGVYKKTI